MKYVRVDKPAFHVNLGISFLHKKINVLRYVFRVNIMRQEHARIVLLIAKYVAMEPGVFRAYQDIYIIKLVQRVNLNVMDINIGVI